MTVWLFQEAMNQARFQEKNYCIFKAINTSTDIVNHMRVWKLDGLVDIFVSNFPYCIVQSLETVSTKTRNFDAFWLLEWSNIDNIDV